MIDPAHPLASWFLLGLGSSFLVVFGLPLMFAPLVWARCFQWEVPEGTNHLCLYFARCLGAVATGIILALFEAMRDPVRHRIIFDLVAWAGVFLTGVHAWGAVRRQQPWTETLEIGLYAVAAATAAYIRTTLV